MTLEDYMKIRLGLVSKTKSLTITEAKILKIDHKKKGWFKTSKDVVIPETTVHKLLQSSIDNPTIGSSIRARLIKQLANFQPTILVDGNKFLYLMRNSSNLYKIGISNNPIKRKASLANTSGFKVQLINYWKVSKDAFTLEQELHKHFQSYRKSGEWFELCISEITMERLFDCVYERMV